MIPEKKSDIGNNPLFDQKIEKIQIIPSRNELFKNICLNKKVLHVGCTDYPLTTYSDSLHSFLKQFCLQLDGMDIEENSIKEMKSQVPGNYYTDLKNITENYDIVLVPETIEHVSNIESFLKDLENLNFDEMVITGPCFFSSMAKNDFGLKDGIYYETVHADHNVWFSPYTLKNCVTKYTNLNVKKVMILEQGHMVGVLVNKEKK